MDSSLSIQLPGLDLMGNAFRGWGAPGVYIESFEGWEGMTSGRREAVAIPFQHGEFDLPVFRGPRVVSIAGFVVARSAYELGQFSAAITGCGADGDLVPITVHLQGLVLEAQVRVIEGTFKDSGRRGDLVTGTFTMQLVAPDPRKYGEQQRFDDSGSVQVHHRGNFPATPTLRIAGTAPSGYTITGPGGRQIVVTRALTAGSPHTLDLASGGLIVGSSRVAGGISTWRPFTIPPRKKVTVSVSDGLDLRVTLRDTYM